MSYDLRLMCPLPGVSLEDADFWHQQVEESEICDEPAPAGRALVELDDAARRWLARSVSRLGEGLTQAGGGATEGDLVEVDQETLGLQICVGRRSVDVTIPYWHKGASGRRALLLVFRCLRVLRDEGSLRVYDPQLGRELDVEADFDQVLAMYARVADRLEEIVGQASATAPPVRRPWWKVW